jgi:hypothetical protein
MPKLFALSVAPFPPPPYAALCRRPSARYPRSQHAPARRISVHICTVSMTAAERRGAAGRDHGPVGRAMASHPRACAGEIRRWLQGQADRGRDRQSGSGLHAAALGGPQRRHQVGHRARGRPRRKPRGRWRETEARGKRAARRNTSRREPITIISFSSSSSSSSSSSPRMTWSGLRSGWPGTECARGHAREAGAPQAGESMVAAGARCPVRASHARRSGRNAGAGRRRSPVERCVIQQTNRSLAAMARTQAKDWAFGIRAASWCARNSISAASPPCSPIGYGRHRRSAWTRKPEARSAASIFQACFRGGAPGGDGDRSEATKAARRPLTSLLRGV